MLLSCAIVQIDILLSLLLFIITFFKYDSILNFMI